LLLGNGIRPYGLQTMNKSQLIDALAARLGDRRTASTAVDGLLSTIVETVKAGESVSLTGFGVFEARARAARVGRNPRTGQTVAVPAATVPAFRPGTGFRTAVGGDQSAPSARTRVAAAAAAAPAEPAAPAAPAAKASKAKPAKATKETKAAKAGAPKTAAAKTAAPKTATAKASAKASAKEAKEAKAPAAKKGKKDTKADAKAAPARKKAKK
jgi:DNA-binding protein HU-beta